MCRTVFVAVPCPFTGKGMWKALWWKRRNEKNPKLCLFSLCSAVNLLSVWTSVNKNTLLSLLLFFLFLFKVFYQVVALADVPSVSQKHDVRGQVQTLQVRLENSVLLDRLLILLMYLSPGMSLWKRKFIPWEEWETCAFVRFSDAAVKLSFLITIALASKPYSVVTNESPDVIM